MSAPLIQAWRSPQAARDHVTRLVGDERFAQWADGVAAAVVEHERRQMGARNALPSALGARWSVRRAFALSVLMLVEIDAPGAAARVTGSGSVLAYLAISSGLEAPPPTLGAGDATESVLWHWRVREWRRVLDLMRDPLLVGVPRD